GPEYTVTDTPGGDCRVATDSSFPPGTSGESDFGGVQGKLVNGRFEQRTDYPLGQNESSGTFYDIVKIEQAAGFLGFP
ncbi:MAG TPA: hypothetical protein VIV15_09740, partial [Anaerolineales bacterium]